MYYTPDIEHFRIGYECEYYSNNKWIPFVIRRKAELNMMLNLYGEITMSGSLVRIPYLTKEQIEAEGWKVEYQELKPKPYELNWIVASKGEYQLWINLALHKSMHLGIDRIKQSRLFRGQCKSINEFRTICKLLKI